ncbi:MAG: dihydroneopterin aldolase [Omnitrophica bacterium GWA2_52_8]|nr:MAG: dihydroneopterin aldolase [Omnitrophica bacterium GWA2_52_8]
MADKVFIEQLKTRCKIGIFAWERRIKQKVIMDMEFPTDARKASRRDDIRDAVNYKNIAKYALKFTSGSEYFLLETLAHKLAEAIVKRFRLPEIRLRISKPGAIRHSRNVGIEVVRKRHG